MDSSRGVGFFEDDSVKSDCIGDSEESYFRYKSDVNKNMIDILSGITQQGDIF